MTSAASVFEVNGELGVIIVGIFRRPLQELITPDVAHANQISFGSSSPRTDGYPSFLLERQTIPQGKKSYGPDSGRLARTIDWELVCERSEVLGPEVGTPAT